MLVLASLLLVALAGPPAAAKEVTRRAYFHANADRNPDRWVNFFPNDANAVDELFQDDYIAVPATGTVWFAGFNFAPQFDEPAELAPGSTIDGTLVFCSEVFLVFEGDVEFGVGRIVGRDVVELATGPGTGCGEFSFSIEPSNRTIPADTRVWFNIDPHSTTVSGLLLMTLSKHSNPSYFDFTFVEPDEPEASDGAATQPADGDGDGDGDGGDGGTGPGDDEGPTGGDGPGSDGTPADPAGGAAGPATPGFGAALAVVAAGLWAVVGRRRRRGGD